MKKYAKRFIGVILAIAMITSLSVVSASAATQYDNAAGVVTYNSKTYSATATLYLSGNSSYISTSCSVPTTRACSYFSVTFYSPTLGAETKTNSNFGSSSAVTGTYKLSSLTSSFTDVSALNAWKATVKIGTSTYGYTTIQLAS